MAYDRELKDKIDTMGAGDLVHVMLLEFRPELKATGGLAEGTFNQSTAYFWAAERLNMLLPGGVSDDDIAAAEDAADAAKHGF